MPFCSDPKRRIALFYELAHKTREKVKEEVQAKTHEFVKRHSLSWGTVTNVSAPRSCSMWWKNKFPALKAELKKQLAEWDAAETLINVTGPDLFTWATEEFVRVRDRPTPEAKKRRRPAVAPDDGDDGDGDVDDDDDEDAGEAYSPPGEERRKRRKRTKTAESSGGAGRRQKKKRGEGNSGAGRRKKSRAAPSSDGNSGGGRRKKDESRRRGKKNARFESPEEAPTPPAKRVRLVPQNEWTDTVLVQLGLAFGQESAMDLAHVVTRTLQQFGAPMHKAKADLRRWEAMGVLAAFLRFNSIAADAVIQCRRLRALQVSIFLLFFNFISFEAALGVAAAARPPASTRVRADRDDAHVRGEAGTGAVAGPAVPRAAGEECAVLRAAAAGAGGAAAAARARRGEEGGAVAVGAFQLLGHSPGGCRAGAPRLALGPGGGRGRLQAGGPERAGRQEVDGEGGEDRGAPGDHLVVWEDKEGEEEGQVDGAATAGTQDRRLRRPARRHRPGDVGPPAEEGRLDVCGRSCGRQTPRVVGWAVNCDLNEVEWLESDMAQVGTC